MPLIRLAAADPHKLCFFGASKSEHGFGLIELLLALGLFSIVVLGIASLTVQLGQQQAQTVTPVQFDIFRRNLIALTLSSSSWKETVKANTGNAMTCLMPPGALCLDSTGLLPLANVPFAIYDGAGNPFYDATNPAQGLTMSGAACPNATEPVGFDRNPSGGNDQCPFRYDLQWTAVCTVLAGNCINPQIKVSATLKYNPKNKSGKINPGNYSMPDTYRSAQ